MRQPQASGQRKPVGGFELIFEEACLQMSGGEALLADGGAGPGEVNRLVVALPESVYADAGVVLRRDGAESDLCASISRIEVLDGADRSVVRVAVEIGAVEV